MNKTFTVTVDGVEHLIEAKTGWLAVNAARLAFPKAKKVTAILKGAMK